VAARRQAQDQGVERNQVAEAEEAAVPIREAAVVVPIREAAPIRWGQKASRRSWWIQVPFTSVGPGCTAPLLRHVRALT
jgi:hypothetical protein